MILAVTDASRSGLRTGIREVGSADGGRRWVVIATRVESFFVGGRYVVVDGATRMAGQAYVQRYGPDAPSQRLPIVLIHGGHQTGVNFETTPDGRPGWIFDFLAAGFVVYVIDMPGRGRSPYIEEVYGPLDHAHSVKRIEQRVTAAAETALWPQAHLHSQWPGVGHPGNVAFDQFYASQTPGIAARDKRELEARRAGAALLDRIGPAILLTHSQSGHFGWLIADERPDLVKGIVAIEPGGPPFVEIETIGAPDYFRDGSPARPYGLTATALTYEPLVEDPDSDLVIVRQDAPDGHGLAPCRLQGEPVRSLPNLHAVPVVVITGEASYHAGYDHCTVAYLRQVGVDASHVRLGDAGIHGNGHMMMLEKNSAEIAALVVRLLAERGLAG